MKYINFHSGSRGNCTWVASASTQVMIDCGGNKRSLLQSLHNWGVDLACVDALLITHNHSDHISQLKLFEDVKTVISPVDLKDRPNTVNPMPYIPFWIGDIEITALVLSHDSGLTYGYVLRHEEQRIVYVTDTGYIKGSDYPHLRNADVYIFESNHDVDMLMQTNRPHIIKARILSDTGHLSNEDSAAILAQVIGPNTKEIVLAHLSEQANTPQLAVSALQSALSKSEDLHPELSVRCAQQYEVLTGGFNHEKQSNQSLDFSLNRLK